MNSIGWHATDGGQAGGGGAGGGGDAGRCGRRDAGRAQAVRPALEGHQGHGQVEPPVQQGARRGAIPLPRPANLRVPGGPTLCSPSFIIKGLMIEQKNNIFCCYFHHLPMYPLHLENYIPFRFSRFLTVKKTNSADSFFLGPCKIPLEIDRAPKITHSFLPRVN